MNAKQRAEERAGLLDEIERFLQEMLEKLDLDKQETGQVGRPRIVPALCLWGGLLVCVLRGMSSQLSIWRLLNTRGLWHYPRMAVTDQAIYNRLATGGTRPLAQLFEQVTAVLADRLAPYEQSQLAPFATGVYALDVTTLDKVARTLPALRDVPAGTPALLPGKLAAVFNIRRQQWQHVHPIASPTENDKKSARALVAQIAPGSLVLADLGYFGFAWFDQLTEAGYWWLSRFRQKTSYRVLHTYYQDGDTFDGLIWLGAYRADRAAHAVRLITFRQGPHVQRYITNLIEPRHLSIHDCAQLYARRWDIELAFKLIKRELGLHLLWSAQTTVIWQQVWAVLIISQILQALRLEIAGRAGVDPFDVSLPLLIEYLPQWSYDGTDVIAIIVERGRDAGFIRPSRRIRAQTPTVPLDQIRPRPPDLLLERKPRYAGRRC